MHRTGLMLAAALCLCSRISGAQSGSLRVTVLGAESRLPLPYSAVTIGELPGRLTDDSGRVVLRDLAVGPLHVRVRHVGYLPAEETVTIAAGQSVDARIELTRAAVTLDAVRVDAERACTDPGPPHADVDSLLATAFQQLEQNARQYRLITSEYPFSAYFRQHYTRLTSTGVEDLAARIIPVRSKDEWRYEPGKVISRVGAGYGVNIPTLSVFADSTFLMVHCFRSAGVDSLLGGATLRVDFEPAARLAKPDLAGSIYLDPQTFVIRRSVIRLAGTAHETAQFDSIIVSTRFEELLPAIPVPTVVTGRDYYAGTRMNDAGAREIVLREDQRMTELRFEKNDPSDRDADGKRRSGKTRPVHRLDRILGVFDASTGEPIPGAMVTDTTDGIAIRTTPTGTLSMAFVGDDETDVRIEKPGYEPQTVHVALVLGPSTPITIALQPIKRQPR